MPGFVKSSYGDLQFDVVITEDHNSTSEITRYPVESGFTPADSKRELPEAIALELVFSNLPLTAQEQADHGPVDEQGASRSALDEYVSSGWAEGQLARLYELKAKGDPLKLTLPWRSMESMVIKSIRVPRNAKLGDAFRVSVAFEQITVVTTQASSLIARTAVPRKPTGKVDQRKKAPIPVTPEKAEVYKSVVKGGLDSYLKYRTTAGSYYGR